MTSGNGRKSVAIDVDRNSKLASKRGLLRVVLREIVSFLNEVRKVIERDGILTANDYNEIINDKLKHVTEIEELINEVMR